MTTLDRLRRVIAEIPRGKVFTYGQVAARAGFPGAARATVWALQRSEGLPWHRVVGAGGRIALPGEEGREQRLRLQLEGVKFRGSRVRMDLHAWNPPRGKGASRSRALTRPNRNSRALGGSRPGPPDRKAGRPPFDSRPTPVHHDRWTDASEAPESR